MDYSIDLTREKIAELKDSLKKDNVNNYTAFKGNVVTDNYVLNYRSPLFRDGQAILANSVYPDDASLKCNNIKNHNGGCAE